MTAIASTAGRGVRRFVAAVAIATAAFASALPAVAADPAVEFMNRFARETLAAARTQSPSAMQAVVARYADTTNIGLFALGDYRPRLDAQDKTPYITGMTRFIGRYAANEAPKYPVADVKFAPEARKARYGITVDSTITLKNGTSYQVAWLLSKFGTSYRVRDAQVVGLWVSPFLKKLFEDYVAQNNGSVKALVAVLQRH
ncbi:MAG TPA: ABC transporter substrate-binding protein [Hyphomicrobiaceae bacterium]|nr:ABC transporter substrate-binding protein [Hyphomicrobiaceae bacterium]